MNENEIGDAQDLYPFNFREISRDLHGAFESGHLLNQNVLASIHMQTF